MLSLISDIKKPYTQCVCSSKKELFDKLNAIYNVCIEKGCDHFDLIINTDVDYEQEV